eukprot:TRINITY_DN26293_c0_g1_i2.p2 TRINITY_DN26293_c0_g1~~TRINITY_DN26293_c0_g1_i2.p2  ORF type:complete len:151 (+),score=17.40 TRINITY_DN26293_c0_g1_i2:294-746(+)
MHPAAATRACWWCTLTNNVSPTTLIKVILIQVIAVFSIKTTKNIHFVRCNIQCTGVHISSTGHKSATVFAPPLKSGYIEPSETLHVVIYTILGATKKINLVFNGIKNCSVTKNTTRKACQICCCTESVCWATNVTLCLACNSLAAGTFFN